MSGRVSVVLATRNGERFLTEQLASIAAQTVPPLEVVVGDDRSDDGTVAVLEAFASSAPFAVDIQVNATRLGYAENFLATAARAKGELLAFCDQDDVWMLDKLARTAQVVADPAVMAVVHGATTTDAGLRERNRRLRTPALLHRRLLADPLYVPHGSRCVFRRSLLHDVPPADRPLSLYNERGDRGQDHDEWVAFAAKAMGAMAYLPEALILHRRHEAAAGGDTGAAPGPRRAWLRPRPDHELRHRVRVTSSRAEFLHALAASASDPSSRDRLFHAATVYDRLGVRQRRRVAIATDDVARWRRAARYAAAVGALTYRSTAHAGLGPLALVQDAVGLVMSRPRSPSA
jgi:glycosyltransferase involved in cell wall biosynthesis